MNAQNTTSTVKIGLISVSDRASSKVYEDEGIPGLKDWLTKAITSPWEAVDRLIPDEQEIIQQTLCEFADELGCALIFTTGGTGPAPRDVTPEATLAVADRVMDGFGERMRNASLEYTPTAILSRQVAVIRKSSLIVNLPGRPVAISQNLEAIFAAVPHCLDLIGGYQLQTDSKVIQSWRPPDKS